MTDQLTEKQLKRLKRLKKMKPGDSRLEVIVDPDLTTGKCEVIATTGPAYVPQRSGPVYVRGNRNKPSKGTPITLEELREMGASFSKWAEEQSKKFRGEE